MANTHRTIKLAGLGIFGEADEEPKPARDRSVPYDAAYALAHGIGMPVLVGFLACKHC